MHFPTVFRSSPVRRAIADTVRPCRCGSRIITNSPCVPTASLPRQSQPIFGDQLRTRASEDSCCGTLGENDSDTDSRSATAMEVVDALEEAGRRYGLPKAIRVDQRCHQFTSKELDLWAYANGVTLDFSRPGRPTDNAGAESFNAITRLERLGQHVIHGPGRC